MAAAKKAKKKAGKGGKGKSKKTAKRAASKKPKTEIKAATLTKIGKSIGKGFARIPGVGDQAKKTAGNALKHASGKGPATAAVKKIGYTISPKKKAKK